MSLWIDIQAAQTPESAERGIGRYTLDLTRALISSGAPIAGLGINPLLPSPETLPSDLRDDHRLAWTTSRSVRRLTAGGPFVHLIMSPMEGGRPSESVVPPWLADPGVSSAAVVYDLIPYLFPDFYMPTREVRRFFQARELSLRQFDVLLAISEYTRSDLIHHWGIHPERVVNIGSGASEFFRPPDDGENPLLEVSASLPIKKAGFVLSIVGYDWRKNAESLIDAWAAVPRAIRNDRQLVLTCRLPDDVAASWIKRGVDAGLRPEEVVVTGFVDDQLLRLLYQAADLLVFPSRYEGFGLPVLEAARCGTPSITSNRSSLPEILCMPESTFDPDDSVGMARVLARALSDDSFFRDLEMASQNAAHINTWDRVAERVVAATGGLDERPHRSSRPVSVAVLGAQVPRSRVIDVLKDDFVVEGFGADATPVELVGSVRLLSCFDVVVAVLDGNEPSDVTVRAEAGDFDILCLLSPGDSALSPPVGSPASVWADSQWSQLGVLAAVARYVVVQDSAIAGRLRIEIGPNCKTEILLADDHGVQTPVCNAVAGVASHWR